MILSHKYRTCFFAVPRTASTAITVAMAEHLAGQQLKPRHIGYAQYMNSASRDVRSYFTFATVRNPMDSVVSAYFKKKTDHNGRFSRGTNKHGRPIPPRALEEYQFIVENEADFAAYLLHFHQKPYTVTKHEDTLAKVDRVLRYETLAKDYSQLVADRGWPDHTIPVTNRTEGKSSDYLQYFPRKIYEHARMVFSPFMHRWGYEFPERDAFG